MSRVVLLAIACALAACTSSRPVAKATPEDAIVTGQVVETAYGSGVTVEDAALLKRVAVQATDASLPLEWANPATGTNGSLVAIDGFEGRHGQTCRSFRTTVATYLGISWFEGEACEVGRGAWTLSWLKRQE